MTSVDDVAFDFEDTSTKIIVSRKIQELKVAGVNIGPAEEGRELETRFWIASHLVSAGLANFHEDDLMNFNVLYKVHWKETKLQTGRMISSLPENFYPKLHRYLRRLREKAVSDATRANEYANALRLNQDIVDCRLRKIVSLSASPTQTEDVLQKLSKEEQILYNSLHSIVSEWRTKILKASAIK